MVRGCRSVEQTIHSVFEQTAAIHSNECAVVCANRSISYAELDESANRLAHHLIDIGVFPGDLIGIHLERGIDLIVAVLAVNKAGGAFLPLAMEQPYPRLSEMLQDSGARWLISRNALVGFWNPLTVHLIDVDAHQQSIIARPGTPTGLEVSAAALAYCIYTSGSTGKPKGVLLSHRGIEGLVAAQRSTFDTSASDRILQFASFGFDAFVFDLMLAFGVGATLVLRHAELGERFVDHLAAQSVTLATLPPGLVARSDLSRVSSLRCLVVAGEACPPQALRSLPPGCAVFNAYGPTESTVWATVHRAHMSRLAELRHLPIGTPVAGLRVRLLDASGEAVSDGEVGELCIGGAGLALGYVGRPETTAASFVPDGAGEPGSRLYRTGDLARLDAEGQLVFIGRMDHQIKIRGYRVELGEIEASIRAATGEGEVAVVACTRAGDQVLAACLAGQAAIDVECLGDALRRTLPEYMVPAHWHRLDALPLNTSGKVDRAALVRTLEAGFQAQAMSGQATAGSKEDTCSLVGRIWAQVLGVGHVAAGTGFRQLGGSSIQAIEVAHRVGREFGLERRSPLPLQNVTLGAYAALVDQARAGVETDAPRLSCIAPDERAHTTDLASTAQHQVGFLERIGEGWRAYRCHSMLELTGPLDIPILHASLHALVRRHDVLRTGFVERDGVWCREVHEQVPLDLPVLDLGDDPTGERYDEVLRQELDFRFDLRRPPLIRWVLVRRGPERHALLQTEHHNVHDGLSARVLLHEMAELYNAGVERRPATVPPAPASYADYCRDERDWLASAAFRASVSDWKNRLASYADDLGLFDAKRPHGRQFKGGQVRLSLDGALMGAVEAQARERGMSVYAFMLSAFGCLCGRYAGKRRFLVGSALANRPSSVFGRTVGMFVNMVPVPFDLGDGRRRFEDVCQQTAFGVDFALRHGAVPLPEIVQALGWSHRLQGEAPFSVGFSFHDSLAVAARFKDLDLRLTEALANGSAKLDLNVVGVRGNGDAQATEILFEYDSDVFDHPAVQRMAAGLRRLLAAAAGAPQTPWGRLPVIGDDEEHVLLNVHGCGGQTVSAPACVHEQFERQAQRRPDAIAVCWGEVCLSYAELDRRADAVAAHLGRAGVRANALVGLLLDRGPDLVAAILGVLKAGAAYVPLDPTYPAQRLSHMMDDAGLEVVLSTHEFRDRVAGVSALLLMEDVDADADTGSTRADRPPASPDGLAYCIFTSGSTGRPKGALNHHRGIANLAGWYLQQPETVLLASSTSFDLTQKNILATLATGGTLVIPCGPVADAAALIDAVRRWEPQRINCAPTAFKAFREILSDHRFETVVLGGEPIDPVLAAQVHGTGARLLNSYGPTECADVAVAHEVGPAEHARVPTGRPLPGVQVRVLDDGFQLAPTGSAGELWISGLGVGWGYVGQPSMTAERFAPDPFGPAGSRMYRTGDVVRWTDAGLLEFMGRVDHQHKVRGFRVELGEIETALLGHPEVREAAVIVADGAMLHAFVAADEGRVASAATLRDHLLEQLPEYMVPTRWTSMAALPQNHSGKVDRLALAEMARAGERSGLAAGEPVEQATGTGAEVLALLQCLLPETRLGLHDDLFNNGIHSLLLMRFVARCKEAFGVELRIRDIYRASTPAALAGLIEQRQSVAA